MSWATDRDERSCRDHPLSRASPWPVPLELVPDPKPREWIGELGSALSEWSAEGAGVRITRMDLEYFAGKRSEPNFELRRGLESLLTSNRGWQTFQCDVVPLDDIIRIKDPVLGAEDHPRSTG